VTSTGNRRLAALCFHGKDKEMLLCQNCHKKAELILNTCADCDPELHAAHDAAMKSTKDFDTMTPEMWEYLRILESRKICGYGNNKPIGILS
jgi:predicted amidophosphoribosyltransferase